MELIYKIILFVHIAAGTVALLSGTISLIRKKGAKPHRLIGSIFFISMLLIGASASIMASYQPNYFLFIVGIFSIYLVSTGVRILYLKNLAQGQKPLFIDWLVSGTMLVFGLAFVSIGLYNVLVKSDFFGTVLVVFGSISLVMVGQDIRLYKGKTKVTNYWLYMHISRMVASNIAAFTAFLVVNNSVLPPMVAWLLPTVIGSALISYWQIKYRRKPEKLPAMVVN